MRAEKWIALCITLLVLSVSVIVIVTLTDPSLNSIETTSPSQDPEQDAFVLINDEALAALFAEANTILDTHTTIALNNNKYIQYYIRFNSMKVSDITDTEAVISLNTEDHPREDLQYLIFLSLIISRYDGYYVETDTDYGPEHNRMYFPTLFLYSGHEEEGYSTIQEYWDAIRSGEASAPSGAYRIDFGYKDIRRYGESFFSPDLYPELSGTGTK